MKLFCFSSRDNSWFKEEFWYKWLDEIFAREISSEYNTSK